MSIGSPKEVSPSARVTTAREPVITDSLILTALGLSISPAGRSASRSEKSTVSVSPPSPSSPTVNSMRLMGFVDTLTIFVWRKQAPVSVSLETWMANILTGQSSCQEGLATR